ncbi:hypothetical protein [Mesorhizobium sp.]|uniref:hypothetical protein n=1 Tax=Mesorhizobium sp. TaxID=1871066 RepID=UPI00120834CC|nr:hypothetical protein [Mesorhizobium sp.]TIL38566.1 MAG: hypothetical protein E5Y82_13810 [Mesorhizobium sp.]
MSKVVFYTEDHFEEMDAEIIRLKSALHHAEQSVESLERLRPHWAQGYSSDSMAAQATTTALSSVWTLLGVNNQTAAMARIRDLLGAA